MAKEAKIICDNTLLKSFYSLLEKVNENSDIYKENIIVVPDKFTMNAERLVFDRLKIESTFNIQVMSLTRLVKKICQNEIVEKNILNKQSEELLITKILYDYKEKFLEFNNVSSSPSLSKAVYETIMQLKASNIMPQEVKTTDSESILSLKLSDIQFIYSEYEKLIQSTMLDSADLLDIFCEKLKTNDYIKSSNLFVGMFDCFSYKQLECIKELCKNSNSFYISLCANTKQKNSNIFLNETFNQVIELLRKENIKYDIENKFIKTNKTFDFLSENLFSNSGLTIQNEDSVNLIEAENIEQEVNFVARKIKQLVINKNAKFDDFNIVCADYEGYNSYIKKIFDSYSLPYYLDYSKSLSEHFYAKFILNVINIINSKFEKDYVIEYINSIFINASKDEINLLEDYITKFGIDGMQFLSNFYDENINTIKNNILNYLINLYKNIKKSIKICDFIQNFNDFFEKLDIKNKLENISNDEFYDIDFKKATQIASEKVDSCLSLINQYFSETACDFQFFTTLLQNVFESTNISTVPLGVNRVFVGDFNSSSFYPTDYFFILGGSENLFPKYSSDCGMITDEEINQLSSKNLLNPTIRFVNKCSKFRLFEICLRPKKQIYICYSNISNGKLSSESEIFSAIKHCLINKDCKNINKYKIGSELNYLLLIENSKCKNEKIVNNYDNINFNFVFDGFYSIYTITSSGYNNDKFSISAKNVLDSETLCNKESSNEYKLTVDSKKLFFPNLKTSVSQLTDYFNCPYTHFLDYGLRLKERKTSKIDNVKIGNVLHKVAELYVNELMENNFDYNKVSISKIISKAFLEEDIGTNNLNEKYKIDSLKKEAKKLCLRICNQISTSDFKPKFTELIFNSKTNVDGINITGKIDRVDYFNNLFVIFDYKTGNSEFNYKNIYYGNKIQLILYMTIIETLYNDISVGAFYIPIKNKFLEENNYFYNDGIILDEKTIINALDITINKEDKSKFYQIELSDGELKNNKKIISSEQINSLKSYVVKLYNNAIKEIVENNITPSPTKNFCDFCAYKGICTYNCDKFGQRKQSLKINIDSFCENTQSLLMTDSISRTQNISKVLPDEKEINQQKQSKVFQKQNGGENE